MFTGIVEEVGHVTHVDLESPLDSLRIVAPAVSSDVTPGDSVAVNGACLTVTATNGQELSFGVMPETLRRTNLGALQDDDAVNLERPLQPQSRLGGHFVQGHIDGVGTVRSVVNDGSALVVWYETSPEVSRYIVEKGFVAIDGASLTVTAVNGDTFAVALIAYTQEHLAPQIHTVGKQVNLEVDVLAKYVEKLVVH